MRLLKFGATWCKPCEKQEEILTDKIEYTAYDADMDEKIFAEFGVRNVPTLIIVGEDNKILHRFDPGVHTIDEIKTKMIELDE